MALALEYVRTPECGKNIRFSGHINISFCDEKVFHNLEPSFTDWANTPVFDDNAS